MLGLSEFISQSQTSILEHEYAESVHVQRIMDQRHSDELSNHDLGTPDTYQHCSVPIDPDTEPGYYKQVKERLTRKSLEKYEQLAADGHIIPEVTHWVEGRWPNLYMVTEEHVPACRDCVMRRFDRWHERTASEKDKQVHNMLIHLDMIRDGYSNISKVRHAEPIYSYIPMTGMWIHIYNRTWKTGV